MCCRCNPEKWANRMRYYIAVDKFELFKNQFDKHTFCLLDIIRKACQNNGGCFWLYDLCAEGS